MKKILGLIIVLTLSGQLIAGNDHRENKSARTVGGKITDAYGETIAGAAVYVAELNKTVYTDLDGTFKIQVPANQTLQLSISTLGFEPLKINSQQLSAFSEISLKPL